MVFKKICLLEGEGYHICNLELTLYFSLSMISMLKNMKNLIVGFKVMSDLIKLLKSLLASLNICNSEERGCAAKSGLLST